MDENNWKNKDNNVFKFFKEHIDRHYMVEELFPKIGEYLKTNNKNKILNIGFENYNKYDKEFCLNDNIYFCGLDKDYKNLPKGWNKMYTYDLCQPIKNDIEHFDAIIDYGVIGWPGVNNNLNYIQIEIYFNNINKLLLNNGFYFLKMDFKHKDHYLKNDIVLDILKKTFVETQELNIQHKQLNQHIMPHGDIIYKTYVFKKKKMMMIM